jgi:hypothetical protein
MKKKIFLSLANTTSPHYLGKLVSSIKGVITVYSLRVFENRVLRRIFGPKKDGVAGGWRKLHNDRLHIFTLRQV